MTVYFKFFQTGERILITAAALVLIICCYLIFSDDWIREPVFNKAPVIGRIQYKKNDARVKFTDNLTWYKAHDHQAIRLGYQIFVGEKSSTQVDLNDGSSLTIGSNSLVVFRKFEKQQLENIELGTFNLKINGEVKIAVAGNVTTLQGTHSEIMIIKKPNNRATIKLIDGKAKVRTTNRQAIELTKTEHTFSLERIADATPKIENHPPSPHTSDLVDLPPPKDLRSQPSLTHVWRFYDLYESKNLTINERPTPTAVNAKIHLAWTAPHTLEMSQSASIELSTEKDFGAASRFTTRSNDLVVGPLSLGEHYWRVSLDEKNWSDTKKFTVEATYLSGAEPTFDTKVVDIPQVGSQTFTTLDLHAPIVTLGFLIQSARDSNFSQENSKLSWSANPKLTFSFSSPGRYYYRFRSVGANQELSDWSKVKVFNVFAPKPPSEPSLRHVKSIRSKKHLIQLANPEPMKRQRDLAAVKESEGISALSAADRQPVDFPVRHGRWSLASVLSSFYSSQQSQLEEESPSVFGLSASGVYWWNRSGIEAKATSAVVGLNKGGAHLSFFAFEGRYHIRLFGPWSLNSKRQLRMSIFTGLETNNNSSPDFQRQMSLLKAGTRAEFPISKKWSGGAELSAGMATDRSRRIETAGRIDYYWGDNWSLGLGYRTFLHEAGSSSSTPSGLLPYREAYMEGFSTIDYDF